MVSTEPQTRPISSHLPAVLAGVAGILLAASGCARTRDGNHLQAWGMEYRLRKACMPRPNHLHILRADLASGNIQPAVVLAADPDADGPAEATLTHPLQLAHDPAVLAFINTNPWDSFADADGKKDRSWFEGQPVEILGLAASGGQMRSLPQSGPASIWLGGRERVFMGECPAGLQVAEGLAGFQPIVREGAVVAAPGGPIHPRTAMGVDPSGSVLWLVGQQWGQVSIFDTKERLDPVAGGVDCSAAAAGLPPSTFRNRRTNACLPRSSSRRSPNRFTACAAAAYFSPGIPRWTSTSR
jgi:hypothetical protein